MDIETAAKRIRESFAKMNQAYQRDVFDEIAIVEVGETGARLHFYEGPRHLEFDQGFADKTALLRKELLTEKSEIGGEFGFTREGEGDIFDAYICLGPQVFLFCNNTEKSMQEVTEDPRWLAAQQKFLNTTQIFAEDPVRLA